MSDVERLNLRELPPVAPLRGWPDRYSQTLLRHADVCMRSAYLYLRYRGGAPSHPLDRGTAAHAVFERMTLAMIEQGETRLYAPQPGEDADQAARDVASFTAAVVDEVLRERPDLTLPIGEVDAVRMMAYHWAVATEINPEKVVGVEQKFVLDVGGREVSGIIDLALIDGDVAEVRDYKSSWAVPEQDEYERGFQGRLYALLLAFGQPVEREACEACEGEGEVLLHVSGPDSFGNRDAEYGNCQACDGRGSIEQRLPPIGERVQWFRTREIYPRLLRDNGELQERSNVLSRTELHDFRADLERLIARVDHARETALFPAVGGDHCKTCPAPGDCPLPAHLRNWAGAINSMEQAAEAAEWEEVMGARVEAIRKELRRFAKAHGPIRYGRDLVRELQAVESRSVRKLKGRADWDGLEAAVARAAELGEPFQVADWLESSVSNRFVKRALSAEELAAEGARDMGGDEDAGSLDERFGVAPPF